MEYVHYHRKVVHHYQVVLEGWPQMLPFKAPSECSSSFAELNDLLQCLRDSRTYWKELTDEELAMLEKECEQKIFHLLHNAAASTMAKQGRYNRRAPHPVTTTMTTTKHEARRGASK